MKQVTLRLDDGLAVQLAADAARHGRSLNAHAAMIFTAQVDPDASGDEVERIRERLRRAGLLAEWPRTRRERPTVEEAAAARAAAGRGRSLSDIVIDERGPR